MKKKQKKKAKTNVVRVCKKHINEGNPYLSDMCPIALAIQDKFPKNCVSVSLGSIKIYKSLEGNCKTGTYKVSKKIVKFISDFDSNKPVKPFSFSLRKLKS